MSKRVGSSLVVVTSLSVVAGVSFWAVVAGAQTGKTAVLRPAGEIQWSDSPTIKGAKMAVLWGDPKTGPSGVLRSVPGGTSLALHTHTHDHRVILVSGTVKLSLDTGEAKDLGAGSYAFIPGGAKHQADCQAGPACVYFEEATGAADFKFVEGPEKK